MDESCAFVQRGMDAGAKGDQHLLSGRQGSGIAAVLTAAFLWFAAAAPAADATTPVAAPEPLDAISTPSMAQASAFWQMVIRQQLIIGVERKSVGEGKSVAARIDIGGRSKIKKKKNK